MAEQDYDLAALRRGAALFGEERARRILDETNRWDPEFGKLFQKFTYGGMYEREVLDPRTRELAAVAALTCLNAIPQVESHARAAVRSGAKVVEVQEVILQMSIYCGFPYALQAMRHLDTIRRELEELEG
jgi:4-carboxymuconolactone decarboxylase